MNNNYRENLVKEKETYRDLFESKKSLNEEELNKTIENLKFERQLKQFFVKNIYFFVGKN